MADFDPDAYLASKRAPVAAGFDPDAYLASKGVNSAQVIADKRAKLEASNRRLGARGAAIEAEGGPSFGHEMLNATGTLAGDFLDGMSFGGYRKARDWAGDKLNPQGMQQLRQAEGDVHASAPGQVASGVMHGVAALTPVGEGKILADVAGAAGSRFASPLLRSLFGGTAAGATADLGEQAVQNQGFDPMRTLAAAGAGAAGGLVTHGLESGANRVLNSKGAQARQLIEEHGGNVGPMSSGNAGPFDAELSGLKPNDSGIGTASKRAATATLEGIDNKFQQEYGGPYAQARGAAEASPDAHRMVDASDVHQKLVQSYYSGRLTPSEKASVGAALKEIEALHTMPDGSVQMPLAMVNNRREMLFKMGNAGGMSPDSVKDVQFQDAAHAAKAHVDGTEFGKANKIYAEGSDWKGRSREQLDLPPAEGRRDVEATRLANTLARNGQNTVTQGIRNPQLEPFKQDNPELARTLELPDVLRAKGDLSFRLSQPGHGGIINRLKHEGLPAAALYGGTVAAGGGHGTAAGVAVGTHLLNANADAINGRLLYGPAQTAAELLKLSPETKALMASNPVVRAYMLQKLRDREQEQKRAQAIQTGHAPE